MKLHVARMQDADGAVYTYIFRTDDPVNESRDYADQLQMTLVEEMPADEFVQADVYELVSP